MYRKKNNRYSNKDNYSQHEDNRFNDGKHYNKNHKQAEWKSRNNVRQDLRKELYMDA